ncbi:lactonase family protein [Aureliella helgolandensis]|uniref:6-phosphogluconolactonase n=1 Tax=Aureliella helgolandensis TaxID=2527968 RepID=A0A518G3X7_9BACT|nr:lactonase family protein [Aureliella helgolandensis]QDV23306.1 6-phosphogluconolactonase [Aureliella helgolandensis]
MALPISAAEIDVWIGTSSHPSSQGIYHCRLNLENGKLSNSQLAAEIKGPGFLAMHPKLPMLYAVGDLQGTPVVAAYRIDRQDGKVSLKLDSSLPIGDGGAAHVSVEPSLGRTLLTAQYGGGSTGVFKLDEHGSLTERTQLLEHTGQSPSGSDRQSASHAHWSGFAPDSRFAFVPDLGLDQVVIYRLDAPEAKLEPHGAGQLPTGAGPRHMKFHPNGRWIYVLNELDLSVSVFDYAAQEGRMSLKQTIPTVEKSELAKEQTSSCAEIRVHPNGKFVYAANRGHDTLTVFQVDSDTGELTVVEREPVRGATPRNFNLAPGAKWLLVGGQDSHTLASFEVQGDTGELTYNRSIINTPAPICVLFGPED